MRCLFMLLLLTACADAPPPEAPPAVVVAPVETCPPGATQPAVPQAPRTVMQLADYANALRRALTVTEDARTKCAQMFNRRKDTQ